MGDASATLVALGALWETTATGADVDWHMVIVDGRPAFGVQLAPNHVSPEWPHGNAQQIHLDLWVDGIDSAHAEVIALGATLLRAASDTTEPENFQVSADPAGHPICLCWVEKA